MNPILGTPQHCAPRTLNRLQTWFEDVLEAGRQAPITLQDSDETGSRNRFHTSAAHRDRREDSLADNGSVSANEM